MATEKHTDFEDFDFNPQVFKVEEYNPQQTDEPYWRDISNEREITRTSFAIRRPIVYKGPTGTGKTTLARRMQWEIAQELMKKDFVPAYALDEGTGLYVPAENVDKKSTKSAPSFPLYIVDGNEDTEVLHLLGGFNVTGKYIGGPVYHWAHTGGILLVNELAEIRGDVQTVFHGALDKERMITFPDIGRVARLPDHALMIATYNPGYQAKRSPLKISTKQRLPAIDFSYPPADVEAEIILHASSIDGKQVDESMAESLAALGATIRNNQGESSILASREGVSTRLLVMAAEYIIGGLSPLDACRTAIVQPLADNSKEAEALEALVQAHGFSKNS